MGILSGKAVIITGAGRGLGRAYAVDAATEDAAVVVNDIDVKEARQVVQEISEAGGTALANSDSVTSWAGSRALIDSCVQAFGRIDGLVNNAGILHCCDPWAETESIIRSQVDVNVFGTVFTGTHAMRVMAEQGYGSIINITSEGHLGSSMVSTYSATKGAVASLTYSWAIDLMAKNIRVNAFAPRAETRMSRTANTRRSPSTKLRHPDPKQNAPVVTYLLSDLSEGVTGQIVVSRGSEILLLTHPVVSRHRAIAESWTAQLVADKFGPILRQNLQPVGRSATT